jgi:DNA-binding transcriptional LysR family regulator
MNTSQKLGFDLWQLEVFRTVVATGSLTKGARQVGLTQSAASQVVATLEKNMGIALLDRDIRPVQATTAGRLLLEKAHDLLEQAHQLETAVRSTAHYAIPVLRIAMVASLTTTLGPDFVRELGKSVKRCALFANLRGVSEQQFHAREIDILIGVDLLKEVDAVITIPLLIEPYALALPAQWDIDVRSLADLKGRNFIRHTHRTSAGRQVEHVIRQLRLEFPREFESDTADTIATMVSAGLGWSITTPLMALQTKERMTGARLLPLPGIKMRRRVDLYSRKSELGSIPRDVAYVLQVLLRDQIAPSLHAIAPWMMGDQLHVFEQARG